MCSEWFSFTLPHAKIRWCEGVGTRLRKKDALVLVFWSEKNKTKSGTICCRDFSDFGETKELPHQKEIGGELS